MADDRGRTRPFPPQRPRPAGGPPPYPRGSTPGAPFAPRPAPAAPGTRTPGDHVHSVRLRDADREVEVSGSPGFIRQILDDLPALLARMRQEPAARPSLISMPPPPSPPAAADAPPTVDTEAVALPSNGHAPADELTGRVLGILRRAGRPIGIAEIRRRLPEEVSGQQVRRVLERASEQVVNTGGRPAEYRLR
jgi:hypothetical protein